MTSSTGRRRRHARSLRAHQTPSGSPTTRQIKRAVVISDKVVMASDHTPRPAMTIRVRTLKIAVRHPVSVQRTRKAPRMRIGKGIACSARSSNASRASTGHLTAWNAGRRCRAIHCTPVAIHLSTGKT